MSFTQTAADINKQKQATLKFKVAKNARPRHLKHSVAKTANFK